MSNTPSKDEPKVTAPGALDDDVVELDFNGIEADPKVSNGTQESLPRIAAAGRATEPVRTRTATVDPDLLRPTIPEPARRFAEEPDLRPTTPMDIGVPMSTEVAVVTEPEIVFGEVEPVIEKVSRLKQDVVYGAIVCEGPDAEIRAMLSQFATDVKILGSSGDGRKVWSVGIYGERPVARAAALAETCRQFSDEHRLPAPTIFFKGDSRDIRSKSAGVPMDALTPVVLGGSLANPALQGRVVVDTAFNALSRHNRDFGYTEMQVQSNVVLSAGEGSIKAHVLRVLRPTVRSLNVAGAENMVGRDKEMAEAEALFDEAFRSGGFRMLMVKGEAYIGKSRLAQELIKKIQAKYPQSRVLFAPAMDFNKNGPRSYLSTFVNVLLDNTSDIPSLSNTEEFDSLTLFATSPSQYKREDVAQILSSYMRKMGQSGTPFVYVIDDSQWIDSESSHILSHVFAQKDGLRNMSALMLSRTGDEIVSPELRKHQNQQTNLKLLAFVKDGQITPDMWNLTCGVLKVDPLQARIDTQVLLRLAQKSGGNPGVLTTMLNQLRDAGVMKIRGQEIAINMPEFMEWEGAGSADAALKSEVERLVAHPAYREVLTYVIAFGEMGDFSWSLISLFFDKYLKKPDLIRAMADLRQREVISINQRGLSDYIFVPREKLISLFKSDIGVGEKTMKEAYRVVAKFAHGRRAQVSKAGYKGDDIKAYFLTEGTTHCNPFSIYSYAEKAGAIDIQNMYAMEAFTEAHQAKNFQVMIRIYEFIMTQPDLAAQVMHDAKFKFMALEAMKSVGGPPWLFKVERVQVDGKVVPQFSPGIAEQLGDELKQVFMTEFQASGDRSSIEKLCEFMVDLYFLRSTHPLLRQEGAAKMQEWWNFYVEQVLRPLVAKDQMSQLDRLFMDFMNKFNEARIAFIQQQHAGAQASFADVIDGKLITLIHASPELAAAFAQDPRFIRIKMESLRMLATSYFNGYNLVTVEIGKDNQNEEIAGEFSDIDACDRIAAADPQSSVYRILFQALHNFKTFIEAAEQNPDLLFAPEKYLWAWQAAGKCAGFLGQYQDSCDYFMGARSMALKASDFQNFGDFTLNLSYMLRSLARNLLAQNSEQNPALWEQGRSVAQALQTERVGSALQDLTDQEVIAWILECSQAYVQQSTDILESKNEAIYLIAMLNKIETVIARAKAMTKGIPMDIPTLSRDMAKVQDFIQDNIQKFEKLGQAYGPAYWDFTGAIAFAEFGLLLDQFASEDAELFDDDPKKRVHTVQKELFYGRLFDQYSPEGKYIGTNMRFLDVIKNLYQELGKHNRGISPAYAKTIFEKIKTVEKFLLTTVNSVERDALEV